MFWKRRFWLNSLMLSEGASRVNTRLFLTLVVASFAMGCDQKPAGDNEASQMAPARVREIIGFGADETFLVFRRWPNRDPSDTSFLVVVIADDGRIFRLADEGAEGSDRLAVRIGRLEPSALESIHAKLGESEICLFEPGLEATVDHPWWSVRIACDDVFREFGTDNVVERSANSPGPAQSPRDVAIAAIGRHIETLGADAELAPNSDEAIVALKALEDFLK